MRLEDARPALASAQAFVGNPPKLNFSLSLDSARQYGIIIMDTH